MSEDFIATDSLSLRPDAGASLPPRKRLLAGFKHTCWSSPPSPSCPCPVEESLVKSNLDDLNSEKSQELHENSVEDCSRVADQADESAISDHAPQRKSRRPSLSSRTYPKRTKKGDLNTSRFDLDPQVNPPLVKVEATHVEDSQGLAVFSEDRADAGATSLMKPCGNGGDAVCLKARGKIKHEKVSSDEAVKMQKLREQDSSTSVFIAAAKPRRNPSRQHHNKSRDLFKKPEAQLEKTGHVAPSISDEELARQLHRAMNSSPRISGCLNCKDGPLLSLNR